MKAVPPRARAYIACVALGALLSLLPLPLTDTPWRVVVLLAAVYAGCKQLARLRFAGPFYPVLLAAAFLLSPPAAALVPLPGALLARAGQRPEGLRRTWRAAQLAVAVWVAAGVHWMLGGRDAVAGPDFPYALAPAGAAVAAFSLTLTALDAGILALAAGVPHLGSGRHGRVPVRRAWQGLFARSLAPIAVHGLAGLMMAVLWRSPYGPVAALLVLLPMCVSWWAYTQYHRERAAHQATIRALVQAVDIKDGYTRGHSERVGQASMMIARELGMDDERVEVLRFAGILHDVGKLGVPTRLLRKDGPLTDEERRVIELHPEYGHEMVRGISFLGEARSAILHHHERLDGSGYPYGLRGGQIPECARVVAVADAFDAMTSTRSYRRARPVGAALLELRRCAGAQFDPRMVAALTGALTRHGWHPAVTAEDGTLDTTPLHPAAASPTHPTTDANPPATPSTHPAADVRAPVVSSVRPAADANPPAVSSVRPSTDVGAPAVSSVWRGAGDDSPAASSVRPAADVGAPAVSSVCPAADDSSLAVSSAPPVAPAGISGGSRVRPGGVERVSAATPVAPSRYGRGVLVSPPVPQGSGDGDPPGPAAPPPGARREAGR